MASVVGVDAGGTKTRAAFASAEGVQRTAEGAAANPMLAGESAAADTIAAVVREVSAGEPIAALHVGAAGAGGAQTAARIEQLLRAAFPNARIAVGDDAFIALRGAIAEGPGIALIAGTGSIAIAVDGRGDVHRVGGLGYLLGDEGSAAWIGLEAVKRLGRVYDGREHEEETSRLVARHLDAPDRATLVRRIYGSRVDVASVAALAPSIIAFAGKGNRVAGNIVGRAAAALVELVGAVSRHAGLQESPAKIALCGGLLSEDNHLVALVEAEIMAILPGTEIVRTSDPLAGAVRLARSLLPAP